ncbi:MAG: hypothetical protein A2V66_10100 [Ignavibacteria bacterium RBG_13_36_8]|nr:MAG: hypothetical protein A2V66_10100 [Ignavibacteria bacterium RBG_13_36_8]
MKRKIFLSLLIVAAFALCTCEEDFNPYGDLRNNYILNCIISNDTTIQFATITHSYMVENVNPLSYTTDPVVEGADIRISFDDSARVFSQSTKERTDQSRYTTPASFYYSANFNVVSDKRYVIDAHLSNGIRLRGETTTPPPVAFDPWRCDTLIPSVGKDWVGVYWNIPRQDLYVSSVFKVYYFKRDENGIAVRYSKSVPVKYIQQGNEFVPHFPEPSYASMIYVEVDAFTRALQEISEGDPNKENYIILAFILEVRIYDENLTSYYAAQREVPESFTLKLDESDYTNIEGGLGVFGSYIKQRKAVKFSHEYIRSFGYIPGLTE